MNAVLAHTILALAVLISYVVLTTLGHDGNPVLVLLGGQLLGAGVQKAVDK